MTGSQFAMNTQVATTLISGGVALVVALLGIAGAIVAQFLASRRAAENSMALLRQQYAEQDKQMRQQYARQELERTEQYARQELERHEEARREDAYRFATERKTAYARFLRLASELHDAQESVRHAEEGVRRIQNSPFARSLVPKYHNPWAPAEAARAREREISAELHEVHQEVRLIASQDVQAASDMLVSRIRIPQWLETEDKAEHDDAYSAVRDRFLAAARKELGIVMDPEP